MSHPIHLILSSGTRIVTRNDANRIGGGQLIQSGAVAVITVSPADAQHAYKVRCNDGAEAMLRRNEFSILKEFKGEGIETTARGIDFKDWQPFIIYRCVVVRRGEPSEIVQRRCSPRKHIAAAANTINPAVIGSGTAVICRPQLSSTLVPPPSCKSAMNNVQSPEAFPL